MILPELLDHAPFDQASSSLRDLTRLNKYFGGYQTLRSVLPRIASRDEAFSVLDVGAASGDMGALIRKMCPKAVVTSLDYQIDHLHATPAPRIAGDAFALPFRDAAFDVVFCSLFLHHFSDERVVELLLGFWRTARRAVVVIDLERNPLAYAFVPWTAWILRWHPITQHDGPISVHAGFTARELRALAERAGLQEPRVRRHLPWFRLSLIASRASAGGSR